MSKDSEPTNGLREHAAPDRTVGEGPFPRLILREVMVIDGTGAPPYGPVDLVLEGNRIASIHLLHSPTARMQEPHRPQVGPGGREMWLSGHYVLPGLVDSHGHLATRDRTPSVQYAYHLWLAHGVTSVRDPGCMGNGLRFTREEADRSAQNAIAAPRIWPYVAFGQGRTQPFTDPQEARAWVRQVAQEGAAGVKFFGDRPAILRAALEETRELGLGSCCHHSQTYVAQANALTTARWGLRSIEHEYGIPEALFTDRRVQDFPPHYNSEDEQDRFAYAGRVWREAAEPGSPRWNEVRDELIDRGVTLVPTFSVYVAMRDVERVLGYPWHEAYTLPSLWAFWRPSRRTHGSAFYDWTTSMEVAWRDNFARWMAFVRDFAHHGGRVAAGTDSGWIYNLWGFSNVQEMELLQEAGLHPLEVVRAATLAGAELLGVDDRLGSVTPGKLADLVVTEENPLGNFKVLYGTGRLRLEEDGTFGRRGGVRYTIKDGVVYDAKELRAQVRAWVDEERRRQGAPFRRP
jgi:dihydroorotase-like cyclic amidohydrolase